MHSLFQIFSIFELPNKISNYDITQSKKPQTLLSRSTF